MMKKKNSKLTTQHFNYEEVFMGVFQGREKGFYKKIYEKKPELRRVVEMVKVKKGGRILDVGCGGGYLTECFPFYFKDSKIFGCDVSSTAIKYAKKYGTKKVTYKVMNKKLPYPSNYFDAITCLDVMEHIPDVNYFISEVKRVLKKDGVFFGAIPCEGEPYTISWILKKLGFGQDLTYKHVGHIHPEFTHDYVIQLFTKKGFKVRDKRFSERLPVQFLRYTQFMLPKELLEIIVGPQKAENYYDRKVVTKDPNDKKDLIMNLRILWFKLCSLTKFIDDIDAEKFRNASFGAWKINLLVGKDGK
jgi:2-polyprenyl-3-methyl-5-hydroxy-6-metoxy-1,4-benzoquinol methylase